MVDPHSACHLQDRVAAITIKLLRSLKISPRTINQILARCIKISRPWKYLRKLKLITDRGKHLILLSMIVSTQDLIIVKLSSKIITEPRARVKKTPRCMISNSRCNGRERDKDLTQESQSPFVLSQQSRHQARSMTWLSTLTGGKSKLIQIWSVNTRPSRWESQRFSNVRVFLKTASVISKPTTTSKSISKVRTLSISKPKSSN